jgi:hypothetical protein
VKPSSIKEAVEVFDTIIKYWIICRHPNNAE